MKQNKQTIKHQIGRNLQKLVVLLQHGFWMLTKPQAGSVISAGCCSEHRAHHGAVWRVGRLKLIRSMCPLNSFSAYRRSGFSAVLAGAIWHMGDEDIHCTGKWCTQINHQHIHTHVRTHKHTHMHIRHPRPAVEAGAVTIATAECCSTSWPTAALCGDCIDWVCSSPTLPKCVCVCVHAPETIWYTALSMNLPCTYLCRFMCLY